MDDIQKLIDDIRNRCLMCKADRRDPNWQPCYFCKPLPKYPELAPEGQIFVCGACGRSQKSLFPVANSSWDESCMMNAILCFENSIQRDDSGTRIIQAQAVPGY